MKPEPPRESTPGGSGSPALLLRGLHFQIDFNFGLRIDHATLFLLIPTPAFGSLTRYFSV